MEKRKGFFYKKGKMERFDSDGKPIGRLRLPHINGKKLLLIAAVLAAVILIRSSYYVLDEDNYAVITTLGQPGSVSQAGLHFKLPFLQRVYFVSKTIKGMPIGYTDGGETVSEEAIMITRDFNFVDTDFYLEYMVSDPVKYLFASSQPEASLKMLAQSYIRDTVGIYNVDDVITTGKSAIQAEIKEKLAERLIQEDIGLSLVNISIQDAFPPTTEVMDAFKNVENAKQGKETAINNANKDKNEKIPAAEAESDRIVKAAEADKEARINEAKGQASRFEQMYTEYQKYPLITRQRMFYETMEELLPNLRVILVDESGTQKLLPLDSFYGSANSAGRTGAGQTDAAGSSAGQNMGGAGSSGAGNSGSGSAGTSGSSASAGSLSRASDSSGSGRADHADGSAQADRTE